MGLTPVSAFVPVVLNRRKGIMSRRFLLCVSILLGAFLPASAGHEGTVLETLHAGGYTYVLLDTKDGPIWLAGPETSLAAGTKINCPEGLNMREFESPALGRTFKPIWFVSSWEMPKTKVGTDPHAGVHRVGATGGIAPPAPGSIAKADLTIAEVFARKADLSGKTIAIRGLVTKVNPSIMGKNWIHLMDGSGRAGTNELTLTTKEEIKPGARILVRGALGTNVDLGAGYVFDVLLEEPSIKVEQDPADPPR